MERLDDQSTVLLTVPGGEAWAFVGHGLMVNVEESVYLAAPDGPRRTLQLAISGNLAETPRILWTLVRTREAPSVHPAPVRGASRPG